MLLLIAGACDGPAAEPPAPDTAPLLSTVESAAARPPPAACRPVHIVVLGSSTAEGTGPADGANTWVARYRRDLETADAGHRLTNLARGGYNTFRLLPAGRGGDGEPFLPDAERNVERALALGADAIVINLPSNDVNLGVPVSDQLANYDTILGRAESAGVPVWIATAQPRDFDAGKRRSLLAMRDSTMARFGERAIDFFSDIGRPDGTISIPFSAGDGIHLNDAAHAVLFSRVADAGIPAAVSCAADEPQAPAG
jgi:lysophospholipase L1-like esterase